MNLSQNEIRARAAAFAVTHRNYSDEMRDTHTFWNDFFFQIFGVRRERVVTYEKFVDKLKGTRGRIDLFWPGELIIEQKSLGRDLFGARLQAMDYLHKLKDEELPKRVVVCDFQTFEITDLRTGQRDAFLLQDLAKHIEKFNFILGRQVARFKDQDPVNIKAAELVGLLHDLLERDGYTGHKLEVFLTRIVFCLFADDTGIFEPKDILWDWLDTRTASDGSDLGPKLAQLFDVLNTDEALRQSTLDPDLASFPYINGHLFAEYFPVPSFNADMHSALLNACRFDWTPISPAIFGSLFQSVMDKAERRKKGAHYTTEKNILKLIGPLFMDDLRVEFDHLKELRTGRKQRLSSFHDKLSKLTFFDPACGCGNFLTVAYRELRTLETDLLMEIHADILPRLKGGATELPVRLLSRIDVDQFYGIEIDEFPARIAETAMWMMDHLMNLALSEAFGGYYPRIPLKKSPHIVIGDALDLDWAEILEPGRCSYVFGNPPFVGQSYQSKEQREQMRVLTNPNGKTGSPLDFVGAWFLKAGAYVKSTTRIAFVATNSITQGEQVALLWPTLFDKFGLEISFAHRTFAWGSDARGKAQVHVVILGLDRRESARGERQLFSYPDVKGDPVETIHRAISPYLFDASGLANSHTIVHDTTKPINGLRVARMGTKPVVGQHYFFSAVERDLFLQKEPGAAPLFRPFIGSQEFINGEERLIIHLEGIPPDLLAKLPTVRERVAAVRQMRSGSKKGATQRLAEYPTEYEVSTVPDEPYLALPKVSSERRQYVPFGWLTPPTIPSDLLQVVEHATLTDFAILTSAMHMAWLRHIGGRLESRYRYSIGLVYNTFPLPPGGAKKMGESPILRTLAQGVLDARSAHPGATLATLYDPDLMPPNLRKAHGDLDKAVDRLYRPSGFASDRERVEHLFGLYEAMVAPLLVTKGRRGRRK